MREIFFIKERCLPGCQVCYQACVAEHNRKRPDQASLSAMPLAKKRLSPAIPFSLFEPIPYAVRCLDCEDAPCVETCLSGSMQQLEENGRVVNDLSRCVGCWMCIMVCPYSALIPLTDARKALKCDSCLMEEPACVRSCPTRALAFCTPADFRSQVKRLDRWNEAGKVPQERVFR